MSKNYNENIENLTNTNREGRKNYKENMKKLSPREKEVYELMISGKTNREICADLCICRGTLEKYITKIYRKKGVKNRLELVFKPISKKGEL